MKMTLTYLLILIFNLNTFAIDTVAEGFRIEPNKSRNINAHGICHTVLNLGTSAEFIPTKTATEWNSFINDYTGSIVKGACAAKCATLKTMGATVSGNYMLDVDGSGATPEINLYCDMVNDGGGWTLMFAHDASAGAHWLLDAEGVEVMNFQNPNPSPTDEKYSVLIGLEHLFEDSKYTVKMEWPELAKRNIWSQTSDPRVIGQVTGYTAISIDEAGFKWGGLQRYCTQGVGSTGTSNTCDVRSAVHGEVTASTTEYWFSIATFDNGTAPALPAPGIPGPGVFVNRVLLWVK